MRLPNSRIDLDVSLVADAGFWINLAAIERPNELLQALRQPVIVPDVALEELKQGKSTDRQSARVVGALVSAGHAKLETLPPSALTAYASLVAGRPPQHSTMARQPHLPWQMLLVASPSLMSRRRAAYRRFNSLNCS